MGLPASSGDRSLVVTYIYEHTKSQGFFDGISKRFPMIERPFGPGESCFRPVRPKCRECRSKKNKSRMKSKHAGIANLMENMGLWIEDEIKMQAVKAFEASL